MMDPRPIQISLARLVLVVMAVALGLGGAGIHAAEPASPGTPSVTYTKVLKGSFPEYLSITVDRKGVVLYEGRKLDDPSSPRTLQLGTGTTQKIFDLAATLDHFAANNLESHKKVANLGHKTLLYDDGNRKRKAEFNYTQRGEARELVDIFERISAVAQHIARLEHSIQFDHLSLPAQLGQIQGDLDRHALEDPELLAPTLEKITRNPRFLHLAKSRAQAILQRIQARQ